MSFFDRVKETALSGMFPRKCPLCGALLLPNERICGKCSDELEFIYAPVCRRCGRPVFDCGCEEESFRFERCVSPFVYTKSVRSGIHRLKFRNSPSSAVFFGKMMAATVRREYDDYSINVVTSVPLHPNDRKRRGYNQAALLARHMAQELELPSNSGILIKSRQNNTQHTLSRQERVRNVSGVFEVARPYLIQNRTVLLCDDIITTGSTLSECAGALLDAGAKRVLCVTAAAVCGSHQGNIKRAIVS